MKTKYNDVFKFKEDTTGERANINREPETAIKLWMRQQVASNNPLTIVINQPLKTRIFPYKLKLARVITLFKKDDDTVFLNDHIISSLPAISNVVEKVIFIQIYNYFQSKKLDGVLIFRA